MWSFGQASPWNKQRCLVTWPRKLEARKGPLRLPEDNGEQGGPCHQAAIRPGLDRGHVRPLHRMAARGLAPAMLLCWACVGTACAHAAGSTMQQGWAGPAKVMQ